MKKETSKEKEAKNKDFTNIYDIINRLKNN